MSNETIAPKSRIREKNEKKILKALRGNEEVKRMQESVKRVAVKAGLGEGVDMFNAEQFPVAEDGFSWKMLEAKLHEADASGAFPQVLRAGVQTIADKAYQTVPTTFEDWVTVVQSSKDVELYAPLHGIGFPQEVGRSEVYPEVGAAGLDISIRNKKYGTMFPVEMELYSDDQTGQFAQQASLLGEYMKLVQEVLVYGKLASVSGGVKYAQLAVPASETKPLDETAAYPYAPASAPMLGGGYNRPASFGALNQANVQIAKIGLMNINNKLGLKMNVDGNRLLCGPANMFNAQVLLNSSYYPSAAGTAGTVGAPFAINPIKGIADLTISRFIFSNTGAIDGNSTAWYLCDDSKPFFVLQMREAMVVEQEATNAGASFDRDIVRYKARARMNADFIDPRFIWQGNDGSV